MISTLSELIMLKKARRRFWVICHWLWAGDFSFLLPSWCRDSTLGDLLKYHYCVWRHPAQELSALNWHLDITRDASDNQEDVEKIFRVGLTSDRLLSTEHSIAQSVLTCGLRGVGRHWHYYRIIFFCYESTIYTPYHSAQPECTWTCSYCFQES